MLRPKLLRSILCLTAVVPTLVFSQTADQWLTRMAEAVEYLNYEGTFVYMTPGKAETFRVFHRVAGDEVTERIVALDGAGAEIIRNSAELICIFPRERSVVVETRSGKGAKGNPLQATLPLVSGDLSSYYELQMLSPDRVLGRSVEVIAVNPRDGFRYGYRLWVDRETAMPLKSQLIGADADMPLEEIRFTDIAMPEQVSAESVTTRLDTSDYAWVRQTDRRGSEGGPQETLQLRSWQADNLPAGFMLTMDTVEYTDMSMAPRIHQVYSDGLATVSVFIDAAVAAAEQAEGLSVMGSATAWSLMKEGMLVTAMGEVPPVTVEQIAVSMRPAGTD